jgi:hypothetical protein
VSLLDPYARARAFLTEAAVPIDFATVVLARIEGQHDELGDSYRRASLGALVAECAEEAADLAAWAALLSCRFDEGAVEASTGRRARALLCAAAQSAAEADVMLAEVRRLIGSLS